MPKKSRWERIFAWSDLRILLETYFLKKVDENGGSDR